MEEKLKVLFGESLAPLCKRLAGSEQDSACKIVDASTAEKVLDLMLFPKGDGKLFGEATFNERAELIEIYNQNKGAFENLQQLILQQNALNNTDSSLRNQHQNYSDMFLQDPLF